MRDERTSQGQRGMRTYQWVITILGVVLLAATLVIGGVSGAVGRGDLARALLIGLVIAGVNWAIFGRRR